MGPQTASPARKKAARTGPKSMVPDKAAAPSFSLPVPEWPYGLHEFVIQVRKWAEALLSSDREQLLQDDDYIKIADLLFMISGVNEISRVVYVEPRSQGRPDRTMRRDYLIAYEFWIRRGISKLGKGKEEFDIVDTASNWRPRGVSVATVRRVRTKYRKHCEAAISEQIKRGHR